MKSFEFKGLIEEFTVEFTLQRPPQENDPNALVEYDNRGNVINTSDSLPVLATGALIPLPQRVIYQSGGRLTEADRQLYSLDHTIPVKSKITYQGMKYHVESKTPYSDFADFSTYTLKGVDSFD